MTKKYIHKTLQAKKEHDWDRYYIEQDWVIVAHSIQEEFLQDFWFIEAPTEEVKDWIDRAWSEYLYDEDAWETWEENPFELDGKTSFRQVIEKHMPKPVEQELIPLDVEKITVELYQIVDRERQATFAKSVWDCMKDIRAILSKYWVHKQEEKVDNLVLKHAFNNATPTPQSTSVDIGEVVNKIMDTIYNDFWTCESECKGTKSTIKEHLSSLPIVQKKRSEKEIREHFWIKEDYTSDNTTSYKRNQMIWARIFLKNHGLFQD